MERKSALIYLKEQLGFTVAEFQRLPVEDKDTLRRWAEEEQDALGLVKKES